MNDYKELCASLREEAEAVQAIEWEIPVCTDNHIREAADVIEHLSAEVERLIKERDAAVKDLHESETYLCDYCKHQGDEKHCERGCRWEWRGLQEGQNERS